MTTRPARAHEEVPGQEDAVQRNPDALADGQVEWPRPRQLPRGRADRRQLKKRDAVLSISR